MSALETAVLIGDADIVASLLPRLDPLKSMGPYGFTVGLTAPGRHLGAASKMLGKSQQARDYYNKALEVCEKIRFRPEIALTRLGLAELLLEHHQDERAAAIEHLDFAINEFREMKMQPSLERALKHKDLLKA